jgi:hypothetical protein
MLIAKQEDLPTSASRPLFRASATERYVQGREETVLPPLIRPRVTRLAWLLLALLVLAGGAAWWAQVPIFVTGSAIVIPSPESGAADTYALALFPTESLGSLHVGQDVFLRLNALAQPVIRPIAEVTPEVLSPAEVARRFDLNPAAALSIQGPSVAALINLGATVNERPASRYAGSVYPVDAEVGSRRLLSLLPVFGRLLEGS